jgi:FkbM family methyltransferase
LIDNRQKSKAKDGGDCRFFRGQGERDSMFRAIRYRLLKICDKLRERLKPVLRKHEWVKGLFVREPKGCFVIAKRRSQHQRNYGRYFLENKDTLQDKYLRLIAGLDEESAYVIQVTISRLMKFYQNGLRGWKKMRFNATGMEAQICKKLESDFHPRVIKFPNGIYAYKNWLLPKYFTPEVFFDKHFVDELENLPQVRGRDIIDAGAFIGDSALVLQDYTDKKVYAFDPNPKHIQKIIETINLNNSNKIVPMPFGLGDKSEGSFMRDFVSGSLSFSNNGVPVNITTLDEWAANNRDVEIGLIKVDIEGFEQKFLAGAAGTIRKFKPAMLLSIYHNAADLFEIKPLIEDMGLGYKFKIRRGYSNRTTVDTMLICEAKD